MFRRCSIDAGFNCLLICRLASQTRMQAALTRGAPQIESCRTLASDWRHTFMEAVCAHVAAQLEILLIFRYDSHARTVADMRKQTPRTKKVHALLTSRNVVRWFAPSFLDMPMCPVHATCPRPRLRAPICNTSIGRQRHDPPVRTALIASARTPTNVYRATAKKNITCDTNVARATALCPFH